MSQSTTEAYLNHVPCILPADASFNVHATFDNLNFTRSNPRAHPPSSFTFPAKNIDAYLAFEENHDHYAFIALNAPYTFANVANTAVFAQMNKRFDPITKHVTAVMSDEHIEFLSINRGLLTGPKKDVLRNMLNLMSGGKYNFYEPGVFTRDQPAWMLPEAEMHMISNVRCFVKAEQQRPDAPFTYNYVGIAPASKTAVGIIVPYETGLLFKHSIGAMFVKHCDVNGGTVIEVLARDPSVFELTLLMDKRQTTGINFTCPVHQLKCFEAYLNRKIPPAPAFPQPEDDIGVENKQIDEESRKKKQVGGEKKKHMGGQNREDKKVGEEKRIGGQDGVKKQVARQNPQASGGHGKIYRLSDFDKRRAVDSSATLIVNASSASTIGNDTTNKTVDSDDSYRPDMLSADSSANTPQSRIAKMLLPVSNTRQRAAKRSANDGAQQEVEHANVASLFESAPVVVPKALKPASKKTKPKQVTTNVRTVRTRQMVDSDDDFEFPAAYFEPNTSTPLPKTKVEKNAALDKKSALDKKATAVKSQQTKTYDGDVRDNGQMEEEDDRVLPEYTMKHTMVEIEAHWEKGLITSDPTKLTNVEDARAGLQDLIDLFNDLQFLDIVYAKWKKILDKKLPLIHHVEVRELNVAHILPTVEEWGFRGSLHELSEERQKILLRKMADDVYAGFYLNTKSGPVVASLRRFLSNRKPKKVKAVKASDSDEEDIPREEDEPGTSRT